MNAKRILLVSNMYPSDNSPDFGVFVHSTWRVLANEYDVDNAVISRKPNTVFKKIRAYFGFYVKVFWLLVTRKYDYVYVHYVSHSILPVLVIRMIGIRPKLILHVHGGDVKLLAGHSQIFFRIKEFFVKAAFRVATRTIFPSRSYAKEVISAMGVMGLDYLVYPSGGIDTSIFYWAQEARRERTLVFAGRWVKTKNVGNVVDAFKLVAGDGVALELAGDGPLRSELLNKFNDVSIKYLGSLRREALGRLFRSVGILIYPSDSESLGLVPIEAMACGVIPILTPIPAFLELKEKGFSIFFTKSSSAEDIADAVAAVLSTDKVILNDLRVMNSQLSLEIYGERVVSGVLLDVFK